VATRSRATSLARALRLPNVEDPADLLTPARLVLRDPDHWPRSPVSAGFDAVPAHWWPRSAWLGIGSGSSLPAADFPEVRAGLIPAELVACESLEQLAEPAATAGGFTPPRRASGGRPSRGNETVVLTGLHPRRRQVVVTLPDERPRVTLRLGDRAVRCRGRAPHGGGRRRGRHRRPRLDRLRPAPWVLGRRDLDGLSHEIDLAQP
jgi:hypothetical protein